MKMKINQQENGKCIHKAFQFQQDTFARNKITYRIKPSRLKIYESKVQMDEMNEEACELLRNQKIFSKLKPYNEKQNGLLSSQNEENLQQRLQRTILEFKSFYKDAEQSPLIPLRLLSLIQKSGITKINRTSFYEFMDVPSIDYSQKELNVWLNTTKKDFMDWEKYGGSLMNYYSGNDNIPITFNEIMRYKGVLGPTQRKSRKQQTQALDTKLKISDQQANRISLYKFQKITIVGIRSTPHKIDYLKRWFSVFQHQNLSKFESIYRLEYEMIQDYKKNQYIQIRGQLTSQEIEEAKELKLFLFAVRTVMTDMFKQEFISNSNITLEEKQQQQNMKEYFNCSVIRFRSIVRSFVRNLFKIAEYYVQTKLNQYIKPITGRQIDVILSPFLAKTRQEAKQNIFSSLTYIGKKLIILIYDLRSDPQLVSDQQILSFYNQVLELLFKNEKRKIYSKKYNLPITQFQVKHIPYKERQDQLTLAEYSIQHQIYSKKFNVYDIFDMDKPNLRGYDWTQRFQFIMAKLFIKMKNLKKIRNFWYEKFKTQFLSFNFIQDEDPIIEIVDFNGNQAKQIEQKESEQNQMYSSLKQKPKIEQNFNCDKQNSFFKQNQGPQHAQKFLVETSQKKISKLSTGVFDGKSMKGLVFKYFRYSSIKLNYSVLHKKILEEIQEIFHYLILISKMTKVTFAIKKFLFLNRDEKVCILSHMQGLKCMLMLDQFWIKWKQRQEQETLLNMKNSERTRHKQWWAIYATVRKNASKNHKPQAFISKQKLNPSEQQSLQHELQYPLLYLTYISECVLEYLETKRHIRGVLIEDEKEKIKIYNLLQVVRGKVYKNSNNTEEKDIVSWKMMQYNQLQQSYVNFENQLQKKSKASQSKIYVLSD